MKIKKIIFISFILILTLACEASSPKSAETITAMQNGMACIFGSLVRHQSVLYVEDDVIYPKAVDGTNISSDSVSSYWHWGSMHPKVFSISPGKHTLLLAFKQNASWSKKRSEVKVTFNALPGKMYETVGQPNGSEYTIWIRDYSNQQACSDLGMTSGLGLGTKNDGGAPQLLGALTQGVNTANAVKGLDSSIASHAASSQVVQQALNVGISIAPESQTGQSMKQVENITASVNGFNNAVNNHVGAAEIVQQAKNVANSIESLGERNQDQKEENFESLIIAQQQKNSLEEMQHQTAKQEREEKYQENLSSLPIGAYSFDTVQYGHINICTCNYCQDFNNNGIIEFPDECVGIKNHFTIKDKITIRMASNINSSNWVYKLWDGNGNLIEKRDCIPTGPSNGFVIVYDTNTKTALKPTSYTIGFYNRNELIKRFDFFVTNNN